MLVGVTLYHLLGAGGLEERLPQSARIAGIEAQSGGKDAGLVPSPQVLWIEAVVAKFGEVNDCPFALRKFHAACLM